MFRLQNHIPNMNITKFQDAYQEKLTITEDEEKLMILMYRFIRKTGNNLQKQQMVYYASVHQFIPTTFSSTSVKTSMTSWPLTVWDIVSNLNLHVKKSFYEQLSKHKENKIKAFNTY